MWYVCHESAERDEMTRAYRSIEVNKGADLVCGLGFEPFSVGEQPARATRAAAMSAQRRPA